MSTTGKAVSVYFKDGALKELKKLSSKDNVSKKTSRSINRYFEMIKNSKIENVFSKDELEVLKNVFETCTFLDIYSIKLVSDIYIDRAKTMDFSEEAIEYTSLKLSSLNYAQKLAVAEFVGK